MKETSSLKWINPLSTNPTKWSNTLKQFVGKPPTNLSVFDHFVGLALKGLTACFSAIVHGSVFSFVYQRKRFVSLKLTSGRHKSLCKNSRVDHLAEFLFCKVQLVFPVNRSSICLFRMLLRFLR